MSQPIVGAAHGGVATVLRLEGLVALITAVLVYRAAHWSWLLFAILFLAPDLTMLGYLANRKVGAVTYNAGHTYLAPAVIAVAGFACGLPMSYRIAMIWTAHIGFDRVLGYGLKYRSAFGDTHLGESANLPVPRPSGAGSWTRPRVAAPKRHRQGNQNAVLSAVLTL